MNYPGNQGQSGGWPPEQSPQSPYSPGQPRSGAAPHGRSPFDPPPGDDPFAPGPGDAHGPADSYERRNPDPYQRQDTDPYQRRDTDPYERRDTGPYERQDTYETAPYQRVPQEPGPYDVGPYGPPAGDDGPTRSSRHGEAGHRGPTPPGRRGNLPLIAGAAVLAGIVLIGGGIGISNVLESDPAAQSSKAPATPTSPAAPSVSATPTKPIGGLGNSRTTDASPLTLSEIFRHRTFKVGANRYTMTARRSDRNCARTVNGARLVTALRRGSCTQVMRATFASADGKLIGTVGVANLRTATAARAAARVWSAKDAWVQPVPGPGITRRIGRGSALGTFQFKGHYLLMTWVQQPSGKDIPSSQHRMISKFGQDVMLGSGLFEALNYRGNVGKPLQK